jgi:hypothetical protein
VTIDDRLTAVGALWSVWAERGHAMTDEQWQLPTRLGDWDVRSLYAHAAMWPATLSALVERVQDAEPAVPTAAALLRYFNAPGGIAHSMREKTATDARGDAARHSTAQMVEQFAATGPQAIADARRLGPEDAVCRPPGRMPVAGRPSTASSTSIRALSSIFHVEERTATTDEVADVCLPALPQLARECGPGRLLHGTNYA